MNSLICGKGRTSAAEAIGSLNHVPAFS
uniref:Uncharacterized protein n=1 Tax=Arundo donax TaxID=35708 RepID=A0A0A9F3M9_ARUDO